MNEITWQLIKNEACIGKYETAKEHLIEVVEHALRYAPGIWIPDEDDDVVEVATRAVRRYKDSVQEELELEVDDLQSQLEDSDREIKYLRDQISALEEADS